MYKKFQGVFLANAIPSYLRLAHLESQLPVGHTYNGASVAPYF